jgi:hypothetical protein
MRTLITGVTLLLAATLLAACGGEEEAEEPDGADSVATTASAAAPPISASSPTATASPSHEPEDAERVTCAFPEDTRSLRVAMTMEMSSSDTPDEGDMPSATPDESQWENPSGFPDLFGGSWEKMTIEYTFVAPDRSLLVASADGQEPYSCAMIGARMWCEAPGSTQWVEVPASEGDFMSPQDLCAQVEYLSISPEAEGKKETVNGIRTVHYVLSEDTTTDELSPEEWPANEGLPQDLHWGMNHEVWLAEDGNWPVRMVFRMAFESGLLDQYSMEMTWEVTHFNDPTITIEAPTEAAPEPDAVDAMTCVFPSDITSFRLTASTETIGGPPPQVPGQNGPRPYTGSWEIFEGFPEDSALEYSYVLPDRWSVRIFEDHSECCTRVYIGSRSWYKMAGSTEWTEEAGPHDMSSSTQEFCECINEMLKTDLVGLEGKEETINGIATRHYQISRNSSMDGPGDGDDLSSDVPWESTYDVWLAEEGNWPVRTVYEVTCGVGLPEQSTTIETWEITDVNDPSIVVEQPNTR